MGDKVSAEDSFRESLKDVATVIEKLKPHFQTFDEMEEGIKAALENDGLLRLLLKEVSGKK